jgi:hypothetical protein
MRTTKAGTSGVHARATRLGCDPISLQMEVGDNDILVPSATHVVKRPNSAPGGVSLVGPQAAASSWLIETGGCGYDMSACLPSLTLPDGPFFLCTEKKEQEGGGGGGGDSFVDLARK